MTSSDPFDLHRFIAAQATIYPQVVSELRQGRKLSHWMWFVFPQWKGLGASAMAQKYAISSRQEAEAYLAHPVLGARLQECTSLVNMVEDSSIEDIFGSIDAMKFQSSMTLFSDIAPERTEFAQALNKYFAGQPDPRTLSYLED